MGKRTFGNIYESRGRWRVRYSIDGKRYDITGGATREAAEAVLARVVIERRKARLDGRTVQRPRTLEEFAPTLWRIWGATLRPSSVTSRATAIRYFAKRLRKPMDDVRVEDANEALLELVAKGLSISTVESYRRIVSSAWTVARRMGYVTGAPWTRERLDLPTAPRRHHRTCSDQEMSAILEAAPDNLRLPILLMREAGLRRGEVATLLWGDITADRRSLTIRAEVAKSHRSRKVPTNECLRKALAEEPPALPTARVCAISMDRINRLVRSVCDELGLTDVTPHTFRHTFGHAMAEAGVNVYVLRDLMGHSSVTTTEVYMGSATDRAMRSAIEQAERHRAAP